MSKFTVLIASLLVAATLADNAIDTCIQQKLKSPTPVSATQLQTGDFQRIPYAARSALQVCHPTFDIVSGQIFKKLTRPEVKPNIVEVMCFKAHLMRKNAEGLLTATFDRNLLVGFYGDYSCDETIENFTNAQIKYKMPYGTAAEIQCLRNSIDVYMSGRFKAQVMAVDEYSSEIYDDEKRRFASELRAVSEELIECLVALG